jgi:hypothetical protein
MMGTVIYSASPLQAFAGLLGTILFMAGIGAAGLVAAIFQRKQGRGARIAMAVAGVFLLAISCITASFTYVSNVSGAQTIAVHLNDKHIRQESCGNNGETCTRYILETNAGGVSYDFVVNAQAYDLAQINTCYQASFYKSKSPLNVTADLDTYHRIEAITRIEVADPAACP